MVDKHRRPAMGHLIVTLTPDAASEDRAVASATSAVTRPNYLGASA